MKLESIFPLCCQYCRKVWLGLYDNRLGNQSESRDELKVKEFMAQKYERKRYYVAPTDSMKDEARRMNESGAASKPPVTRPLKSLLGENAPKLLVGAQVCTGGGIWALRYKQVGAFVVIIFKQNSYR